MFKLSVLYGPPQDATNFEPSYARTYMPLVRKIPVVHKIPGLGCIERAKVADPPRTERANVRAAARPTRPVGPPDGSAPAFYRIFEFWFDNQDQMNQVVGSAEGQASTADLANFASGLLLATQDRLS